MYEFSNSIRLLMMKHFLMILVMLLWCNVGVAESKCIDGDCNNGQGTLTLADGGKYIGEFKNSKRHGQGTVTYPDGLKYVGEWKNDKVHGQGTATYASGAKYVGEFKNDKPHGEGTFTYSNGSKYYGEWKNGKAYGQGIKTWKDGREYSGGFKNDKPHGQGTFIHPVGSKYFGQYKDGKRHGEGTLMYADGKTYIGAFAAGLAYGKGLCINVDGSSAECTMLKIEKGDTTSGKNRRSITIEAKKWVKLSEYESVSGKGKKVMDQLGNDFTSRASELCSLTGNFKVLEKRIEVLEIDETPAFGLEPKIKIGVNGVVECT